VLRRVRSGELADRAADAAFAVLEPRDRAWAQELVYGTLRLRGRLDHLLGAHARGGVGALEPDVLDVLRLGAYQLLEMGSVPSYAAVSQSQELVRSAGVARAAGLVAGVLHALARSADAAEFPDLARDPVAHLATWGSHPRWLVERWVRRWGADAAAELVRMNNQRPELYLRPLGVEREVAVGRLEGAGIAAEAVPFSAAALRILPPAGALQALEAVPSVVQDPAAALVVEYAAVPTGATVLDLCAAPGGKALGMAERAARVIASDLSVRRLARLQENAGRVGWQARVAVVAADGRFPPYPAGAADLVLLDAPCTGTGTFRRHPDGRWRLARAQLRELAELQALLLERAAPLVRRGGWLVYSTCSLEEEENELQIDRFLQDRAGEWDLDPVPGSVAPELLDARGRLVVYPHRQGVDGAFAARLRRGT
jgi:16S rRNA (cytosine967-C5)-methyltransferase